MLESKFIRKHKCMLIAVAFKMRDAHVHMRLGSQT